MVKVGVVGCGYWGPNLIRNFNEIEESDLTWCCDLDSNKLKAVKNKFPFVKISRDHNEILDDESVDAIVIATPPDTHYKIAEKCLLKGKHVLVEKPIAFDVNQAQSLVETANKTNRILMVGHTFEFNPAVIKAREYINSGTIGDVYYIVSRRINLGIVRSDINAMWSIAPHDISILIFLLGVMPLTVRAWGSSFLKEGIEDVVFLNIQFPKNILAHIQVSWLDPHKIRDMVIVGSKKMIVYDDIDNEGKLKIYDKGVDKIENNLNQKSHFGEFHVRLRYGDLLVPKLPNSEPLKKECEHFIECIKSNKKPLTDGENGLRVIKVLDAAYRSLKKDGKSIDIV